jgi:hypothetical protein
MTKIRSDNWVLSSATLRRPWRRIVLAAVAAAVLPLGGELSAAVGIHVAPGGDDRGPGSAAAPLATLHRAREKARERAGKETVHVWLHGGRHELREPLVFDAGDSGSAAHPVTWAAVAGERAVVSGGCRLKLEWQPFRGRILRATVPPDCPEIDQLFVGGRRRPLARWPDYKAGPHGMDIGYASGLQTVAGPPFSKVDPPLQEYAAFRYQPDRFTPRSWAHPEQAVIHIFQETGWGNMQWRISGREPAAGLLRLGAGGWQIGTLWWDRRANKVGANSKFYIEGVIEELDADGEWYFDEASRSLFYQPVAGEEMDTVEVVACGLRELFVVRGTADAPVRHLRFQGLAFAHTARTLLDPYETRLRGDWALARRAALRFDGAEDCAVRDCEFTGLGGNGVLLSNYNRKVGVSACHFSNLGESAVLAVGSDTAVREPRVHRSPHVPLDQLVDTEPGPKSPDYPANCRIQDNLMHDLGVFGKQVAGVFLSACEDIEVSHNTICRVPRAGICINDGCWGGHRIEGNDLFLTVLETSDHGPINAWGRDRYWQSPHREGQACDMALSRPYARLDNHKTTVIRNNRLVHEQGFSWGIDLDDGASNYLIEDNLCVGCSLKLREGYFRTVRNNIFISPNPPSKHCCFEGSDDIFLNNICVNTRDGWALSRGPATLVLPVEIDRNVYFNTAGLEPRFGYRGAGFERHTGGLTFEAWRGLGADLHSVSSDPRFLDRDGGDFRLAADSPALALGFKPFPLDRFGTRKESLAAAAARLRPAAGTAGGAATREWLGARIRSVAEGVGFLAVPAGSAGFRAGFRQGDVLTHMNGSAVAGIDELTAIISAAPAGFTEFRVRRAAGETVIRTDGPGGVPAEIAP